MNRLPESAVVISAEDLQWARAEGPAAGKRAVELLEERLGCGPAELMARLSSTLRLPILTLEDLRGGTPAFELISYADAARRCCLAVRAADGELSVVLGDPFDLDTQDWIEEWLRVPFGYRIAHRVELAGSIQ